MGLPRKIQGEFNKEVWKEKGYQKVFYIMVTGIVVIVSLFAVATYYRIKRMVMEQNTMFAIQNFENACDQVEAAQKVANSVATQLLLYDVCGDMLFAGSEQKLDSLVTSRIAKQLTLYQKINDEIKSIYLYNGRQEYFVASEGGFPHENDKENFADQGIVEIVENYEQYRDKKFIRRTLSVPSRGDYVEEMEVYTVILDSFKGNTLYSGVIINLPVSKIYEKLMEQESVRDSNVMIYEGDEVILDIQNLPQLSQETVQSLVRSMEEEKESFREFYQDGEAYVMLWLTSQENGWNYVQISRWSDVFSIQRKIRNTFLILVCIIILLAVCISRACSMLIYWPFVKIKREYKSLVKSTRRTYQSLKEDFLYDFMNEKKLYSREKLEKNLAEYGFAEQGKRYTLAVLKIDRYDELAERFGEETYLIKFGFRNIFEELGHGFWETHGIIYPDDRILFVIGTEKESIQSELKQVFLTFCEKEKVFLEWSFHMMSVEEYVSAEKLPDLKRKIWLEIETLFFYEAGQMIPYEELIKHHQQQLDYSQLNQKEVQEALYSGSAQAAEEAYQKYKKVLEGCDVIHYRNALTWLAFSVAHIVDEYRDDISEEETEKKQTTGGKYLTLLSNCDTIMQSDQLMKEFFEEALCGRKRVITGSAAYSRMEEIKQYIQLEFRNSNLCQDLIAEQFDLSAPYLGRQFRKYTGMSVSEYINKVRLEAVLVQMRETQSSIKDIALENGFEAVNYFYTYFKKKMGVTPQTYRELEKNENINKG